MWRWWVVLGSLAGVLNAVTLSAAESPPLRSPSTILIDAESGQALAEQDADAPHPTDGLNQLMVLLLAMEQVEMGRLPLSAPVTVSPHAATLSSAAARIPLTADKTYLLGDLMMAMAVSSAVDAEVAVAEAISGTLPACLELMNARAQRLGMTATHYGALAGDQGDDGSVPDATTARDVARLAQALLRHQSILQWASSSGFPFDHGATLLRNANRLLGAVDGVDGLMVTPAAATAAARPAPHAAATHAATTRGAAGRAAPARSSAPRRGTFDIVATAQRQSLRLVAVVLGAPDSDVRYQRAAELLDWGFGRYDRLEVVKEGERLNVEVRVANGATAQLTPVAGRAVSLLRRRDEERDLQVRYQVPTMILAPVKRHQTIGELIVEEHGAIVAVIPVVSPSSVAASGVLSAALP